jgi:ABC-type sugar transport system substrate-binding protein
MSFKKSSRVWGAGAIVAVATLLSACSSGAATSTPTSSAVAKHITIGFSPLNQTAAALIGLAKGIQGYGASKGDKVLIADPANSAVTQVQQLKSWIENGQVQGVWVLAISQPSMKQIITLAQQKHVVLVLNGSASDYGFSGPQPGISFSTINYSIFGGALGKAAAACSNARLGGKAKLIINNPMVGESGASETKTAFLSALKKADPGATVVSNVQGDGTRLTGQNLVASALQANPDANMVFTQDDDSTLGAMDAFKTAGKDLSKECLMGGGGGDDTLAEVKAGNLYGIAALQFNTDLIQTVDILNKMAQDPTKVGVAHTTPVKVITK